MSGATGGLLAAPLTVARRAPGASAAAPEPLQVGPSVSYSKDDAFEICGALALAESALRAHGDAADAALLGAVFEVAEAGLTRQP